MASTWSLLNIHRDVKLRLHDLGHTSTEALKALDENEINLLNETFGFDVYSDLKEAIELFESKAGSECNALEMLKDLQTSKRIKTSITDLDALHDGGIPIGSIIEFAGEAGTGKTQFCHQMTVNTILPESLGGLGGEVLYIDTEKCFIPERINQILAALGLSSPEMSALTAKIHFSYVFVAEKFIQLVTERLENLIKSKSGKIRLVVIDSIAAPFRAMVQNASTHNPLNSAIDRRNAIHQIAQTVRRIAANQKISFVIANQVTGSSANELDEGPMVVVPALGTFWAGICSERIFLERNMDTGSRRARLTKSTNIPDDRCYPYSVENSGIVSAGHTIASL